MILSNKKVEYGPRRFNKKPVRHDYSNLLEELKQESEQGNLSLLEKTILKQEENKKNITATGICKEITEQELLKRRRESLMSDIYNLYAYSHTELLYHDRDCKLVLEIPDDEFQMSAECKPLSLCPICEKRAIIRGGIIDDYKHIDDYMVFFKGATVSILHFLVLQNGGKLQ